MKCIFMIELELMYFEDFNLNLKYLSYFLYFKLQRKIINDSFFLDFLFYKMKIIQLIELLFI